MPNQFLKNFAGILIILGILAVIATPIIYTVAKYQSVNEYTVTIDDKEAKNNQNSSKYLIFTTLEDGDKKVFENTDAWFAGKFDSSDMYNEFEVGETYTIRTHGWRIPVLSMHENILAIEDNNE